MWFVQYLVNDPQRYFFVVVTVVISIVCHELAHGYMAMHRGDTTPESAGHLTGNPLVHMGPFSLAALFLCGIAWGQMPINPARLRGKYAEALVAIAGPATNLGLAFMTLTGLGLWARFASGGDSEIAGNAQTFLLVFGTTNLLLCAFNLMPVPPLDGSHILANFHRGYAIFISDPSKQQFFFFGFIMAFMISGRLAPILNTAAYSYLALIMGS